MENIAVKKNKKGFTLVELVIVIAVLAILAAIAVPTVTNVLNSANVNTDASNAQTIELALKSAYAEASATPWSGAPAAADLTVDQALAHEGLDKVSVMNGRVKEGSGFRFAYASGHISCTNSTDAKSLIGDTDSNAGTKVKDALSITT